VERALELNHVGMFARTDSRKSLGSMNDLVRCYTTMVQAWGGLQSCDLTAIIMKINEMPQRTLGWRTAWDMTEALLQASQASRH
jgi:IS30 family transposase